MNPLKVIPPSLAILAIGKRDSQTIDELFPRVCSKLLSLAAVDSHRSAALLVLSKISPSISMVTNHIKPTKCLGGLVIDSARPSLDDQPHAPLDERMPDTPKSEKIDFKKYRTKELYDSVAELIDYRGTLGKGFCPAMSSVVL